MLSPGHPPKCQTQPGGHKIPLWSQDHLLLSTLYLLPHPLQTARQQSPHCAENWGQGEKMGKILERQFTKEGQMTTKRGKRTIVCGLMNPETWSTTHQAGDKARKGGDPTLATGGGEGARGRE